MRIYLALSGECFHNVTVTGGKKLAEGPLQMKRDLREVQRQIEELGARLAAQEHSAAQLGSEIHALAVAAGEARGRAPRLRAEGDDQRPQPAPAGAAR